MKRVPTDELIAMLARDLRPTGHVGRLRTELATVVGAAIVVMLLLVEFRGITPNALSLVSIGAFALVAAGLLGAGVGGCAAALASARPDRERLAWGGVVVGMGGLVLSAGVATHSFGGVFFADRTTTTLQAVLPCLVRAILLAIPLSLFAARLVSAGAGYHLGWTARVFAFGATAFGGLAVHFTCPAPGIWHWIIGHAMAPVAGVALLAAPLRALTRRWGQGG